MIKMNIKRRAYGSSLAAGRNPIADRSEEFEKYEEYHETHEEFNPLQEF